MEQSAPKTVIITGGSSGLGLETARKIAADPAFRVVRACRNRSKAERAAAGIQAETGNANILWMELDTASLDSVRRFTDAYVRSGLGPVHALVCNAGISGTHTGRTADGFDIIFQTNHLGHFLLATRMLPQMAAGGRIFAVSSDMHDPPSGKMVWPGAEALAHPDGKLAQNRNRYSYSKLCNLYFVYELARRLQKSGQDVYVNAFNPGLMKTNFMPLTKASIAFVSLSMPHRLGDLGKSSAALAELVTVEGAVTASGLYYDRSMRTRPSSELSYNQKNAAELWAVSEKYVGSETKTEKE